MKRRMVSILEKALVWDQTFPATPACGSWPSHLRMKESGYSAALHRHRQNIDDELAKDCAATGGVVGVNAVGIFLGDHDASTQGGFVLRPFASPARELPEIVDFFPVS